MPIDKTRESTIADASEQDFLESVYSSGTGSNLNSKRRLSQKRPAHKSMHIRQYSRQDLTSLRIAKNIAQFNSPTVDRTFENQAIYLSTSKIRPTEAPLQSTTCIDTLSVKAIVTKQQGPTLKTFDNLTTDRSEAKMPSIPFDDADSTT